MSAELYNMPLALLSNEQIMQLVKDAIREERKVKKARRYKKSISPDKFFSLTLFKRTW